MDNNNTLSDNISLSKDFIDAYTLQYYHYLTTAKQVLILGAGFGGLASANYEKAFHGKNVKLR